MFLFSGGKKSQFLFSSENCIAGLMIGVFASRSRVYKKLKCTVSIVAG
jgi:hypothetical protein